MRKNRKLFRSSKSKYSLRVDQPLPWSKRLILSFTSKKPMSKVMHRDVLVLFIRYLNKVNVHITCLTETHERNKQFYKAYHRKKFGTMFFNGSKYARYYGLKGYSRFFNRNKMFHLSLRDNTRKIRLYIRTSNSIRRTVVIIYYYNIINRNRSFVAILHHMQRLCSRSKVKLNCNLY